jgi:c-di-GMP-binding flagellar brake protein YcgR
MTTKDADKQRFDTDFESIGFLPGATMQLQAIGENASAHHWVKYIGFIKNNCILTTLPLKYGKGMMISKNESYVVRGFNGTYAYAFATQVIDESASPFAFVYFAWPDSIESLVVRNSVRVEVELPASVSLSDNTVVSTMLSDLSVSGAMLDSPRQLGKMGDHLQAALQVNLEGHMEKMNVSATIRNVHHKEGGAGFRTGVEFNDISQNHLLILNYFVDSGYRVGLKNVHKKMDVMHER